MSAALSPETSDLLDALVGAAAIAKRARERIEAAAGVAQPADLPEADESFILALLGIAAISEKLESALAAWSPSQHGHARAPAPPAAMRDLLR